MAKMSVQQLASYVVDELDKGVELAVIARKLASYLLENRQSREVSKVLRAVELELNRRGKPQVEITSVHAVSDEIKKELVSLLGIEKPVFSETLDSSVIGGVKARSGEVELDLTIRSKLNKFKVATRSN